MVEWRQADGTVAEYFNLGAAGAKGDYRAENGVAHDANHQLASIRALQIGLDRDAVDSCLGSFAAHCFQNVMVGVAHRGCVGNIEPDAADFALADEIR